MKKSYLISILFLGISTAVPFRTSAQEAMPTFLMNADASALYSAGATVASEAEAFVLERNPAMMSFYEGHMDAALSYSLWSPASRKEHNVALGGFCRIGKRIGLGLHAEFLLQQPYTITDGNGIAQQVNGVFRPGENNFALGLSCLVTDWLSLGANFKLGTSKLAPGAKASAFAADIYAAYKSSFGLSAGLGVCNLGTKVKYGPESIYALPSYLRAGVSYGIMGLRVNGELDFLFSKALMAGVSASWWYKEYAGLSVGYHYGGGKLGGGPAPLNIPSYFSLGVGAAFKGLHLDLAYLLSTSAIKNTISCTIGYRF